MPDVESIYKEYGENKKDVVILGINSEKENEAKKFLKDEGYTFPTVIDENSEVMREYFIQAFPTSFVIDKEGNVYGYVMGGLTKEQIKQVIEEVLKKQLKIQRNYVKGKWEIKIKGSDRKCQQLK